MGAEQFKTLAYPTHLSEPAPNGSMINEFTTPLSVKSWSCGGNAAGSSEAKNRPRAHPGLGAGGGDRDAMATLEARYWPR
jgi:hypothetical protein